MACWTVLHGALSLLAFALAACPNNGFAPIGPEVGGGHVVSRGRHVPCMQEDGDEAGVCFLQASAEALKAPLLQGSIGARDEEAAGNIARLGSAARRLESVSQASRFVANHALDASMSLGEVLIFMGVIPIGAAFVYLINYPDADVQYYNLYIVADAASVFIALVIVHVCERYTDWAVQPLLGQQWLCVGHALLALLWYGSMQCRRIFVDASEVKDPEARRQRGYSARFWSGFLGNAASFAAINVWGDLQEAPWFDRSPAHPFLVCVLAFVAMDLLFITTKRVCPRYQVETTTGKRWERYTEEAEEVILASCTSFLFARALLRSTSGCHAGQVVTVCIFAGTSASFATFVPFLVCMQRRQLAQTRRELGQQEEGKGHESPWAATMSVKLAVTASAWTFVEGGNQFTNLVSMQVSDMFLVKLVFAVAVSLLAFLGIIATDRILDSLSRGSWMQHVLINAVIAAALVIGFCWEEVFETVLASIEDGVPDESEGVLVCLLSLVECVVVGPALRFHVLPKLAEIKRNLKMEEELDIGEEILYDLALLREVFDAWVKKCESGKMPVETLFHPGAHALKFLVGTWIDINEDFFSGAEIEITQTGWGPRNARANWHKTAVYQMRCTGIDTCELVEKRRDGTERVFTARRGMGDTIEIKIPKYPTLGWTLGRANVQVKNAMRRPMPWDAALAWGAGASFLVL
eukprot:CAMPEP_0179108816 /NCGR_PEP_ID=MMETSP0796-20121207/50703_1 /TAXON_ID=73915 /ORGANISM="Pyrodinium bahamense, Strain pbaha01" /LENGTH=693 /DNA_ID=CAMNT_0020806895 /DNA_START=42 /DNA_END=2124 /DNA_ORIENTATION=+